MKNTIKQIIGLAVLCTALFALASTAHAATTTFTCNYSGTYNEVSDTGTWNVKCSGDDGSCSGSGTSSGGKMSGTCDGRSIFGRLSCTVSGTYNVNTSTNTATVNVGGTCKSGVITANCSGSGSGSYSNRGAFKGSFTQTCNY